MSASVLFDAPGPRTRRLYLVVGLVGTLAMLAAVGWLLWLLREQLVGAKWAPFLDPVTWSAYIWPGFFMTVQAALISVVSATVLGLLLGLGRLSHNPVISWVTAVFVEFFRSVPVLLMMIFSFAAYLQLRILTGDMLSLAAVVTGLTLYNSCVLAELVRSGVHGLPAGQREAAYALGLTRGQALRLVLLPQAITAMLPSLVSQLVVILKDTALGYIVTYPELTRAAATIDANYANLFVAYMVIALIYIVLNWSLTVAARKLEAFLSGRRASPRAVVQPNLPIDPDPSESMYGDPHRYRDPADDTR